MTLNGRIRFLHLLPFLLYLAAPSNALQCIVGQDKMGPGGLYTREDALKELKEKIKSPADFKAMDVKKNVNDAILFGKAVSVVFGEKQMKQQCQAEETCCFKYSDYKSDYKGGQYTFGGCASTRICKRMRGWKYSTCNTNECNRINGNEKMEDLTNEVEQAVQVETFNLLAEISPEMRRSMEQAQAKLRKANAGGEQATGPHHLLMILSIVYVFM